MSRINQYCTCQISMIRYSQNAVICDNCGKSPNRKRHSHHFKGVRENYDEVMLFVDTMKQIELHLYPEIAEGNQEIFKALPKPSREELRVFVKTIYGKLSEDRITPRFNRTQ